VCTSLLDGNAGLVRAAMFTTVPLLLNGSRVHFGVCVTCIPKVIGTNTHLRGELHGTWEYRQPTAIGVDKGTEEESSAVGKQLSWDSVYGTRFICTARLIIFVRATLPSFSKHAAGCKPPPPDAPRKQAPQQRRVGAQAAVSSAVPISTLAINRPWRLLSSRCRRRNNPPIGGRAVAVPNALARLACRLWHGSLELKLLGDGAPGEKGRDAMRFVGRARDGQRSIAATASNSRGRNWPFTATRPRLRMRYGSGCLGAIHPTPCGEVRASTITGA
jgi:hypothetical protein